MNLHTEANAVPPLNSELETALTAIRGIHPGLDMIADGLRLIALDRFTPDTTQTALVALAGSSDGEDALAALAYTTARLTDPDTNPALRTLGLIAQKDIQGDGAHLVFDLTRPGLHQHASTASGAIHTD